MKKKAQEEPLRGTRPYIDDISAMGDTVEEMLRLIIEGFDRFRLEGPREARKQASGLEQNAERVTAELVSFSEKLGEDRKLLVRRYLGVAHHLQLIGECCRELSERVTDKIQEGVLFSDKAFKEFKDLYIEVSSLLHSAILTLGNRDERLAREVAGNGKMVEGMIDNFSSEHEKRLISGVCAVRSSALFLDMLDAMRRIAGHAVGMVSGVCQDDR